MKALRLLLPVSLLVAGTCSAATITAQAATPSSTDVFNNASIISTAPLFTAFGGSSASNMFGATGGVEPNNTIFADGSAAGTPLSVVFNIGAPQLITGYNLFVADDSSPTGAGSNNRSITRFQLYVGATLLSDVQILATGQSNSGVYGGSSLTITDSFAPVTGNQFTAVFYTNNGTFNGPRIVELDAVVPEPGTISMLALGGLAVFFARRRKA